MPRDEIHALATCRCNQESLKQVAGVRISFSYEAAPKADGDLTRMELWSFRKRRKPIVALPSFA